MASLNDTYNLDNLPESTYDLIPDGWYQATIVKGEIKPTKDSSGENINFRLDIIGPTHQGRCVFLLINIKNQDSEKEKKGRARLGDLMRAAGLSKVTDTDQFLGKTLQIKIGNQKATEEYPAKNTISSYKAITGSMPPFTINNKNTKTNPEENGNDKKAFWAKK